MQSFIEAIYRAQGKIVFQISEIIFRSEKRSSQILKKSLSVSIVTLNIWPNMRKGWSALV